MGVRDWPTMSRDRSFREEVPADAQRYVLEGTGLVRALDGDGGETKSAQLQPGALLTVEDACTLEWTPDEGAALLILTPTYQQPLVFVGFALATFALFAALIGTVSS